MDEWEVRRPGRLGTVVFARCVVAQLEIPEPVLSDEAGAESVVSTAVVGREPLLCSLVEGFLRSHGLVVHPSSSLAELSGLASLSERNQTVVLFIESGNPLSSLGYLRQLLEAAKPNPVVVVAMQVNVGAVHAVLRLGARAILSGQSDAQELLRGVRMAARGKIYVDSELVGAAMHGLRPRGRGPDAGGGEQVLSRREEEIVSLLCDGLVTKDVARHLHLSVKTVENHKYNIYRKCGVSSPTELLRYAIAHSLTSL